KDEYTPPANVQPFDLELSIVTSEANFWDRVAGLKATEAPEVYVTDDSGAVVTGEDGEPVIADENAEVTSVPEEGEVTEVTKSKAKTKK
ncbi:MAG: hypothetical protein J6U36_04295, partial [Oscillospiraceae bacterium]|nr:hypothetical protein [Oscillospiraceae bacterium]